MNSRLTYLFDQYYQKSISDAEKQELFEYLGNEAYDEEVKQLIGQVMERDTQLETLPREQADLILQAILKARTVEETPVYRVRRMNWIKYAAAIIILFGIGTYLYLSRNEEKPSVTQTSPVPVQNDVAPGGNRATLTLADGSKINLDSASNGKIAEQGKTMIEKKGEQIVYTSPVSRLSSSDSRLTPHASRIAYNTMTTPRGGQYQLTLPDGTQVWLNAESSITYPTSFSARERERRVSVTGEAYFEVAKNKAKPFIVSVSPAGGGGHGEAGTGGGLEIEVLGTHFNVNSYKEEPTKNTTLLEGSVRLTAHRSPLTDDRLPSPKKTVLPSLTLKPGQQGQLDQKENRLSLAAHPDIEQVMAWKNGVFNFNKVSLEEAMRQIARWYDVEVVYESGKIPDMRFGGKMGRDLKLSQVLNGLQAIGVAFRIEGKKLIVTS